jgi:hypothetical protein
MGTAPRTHLARIQALLSLAQSAALLVFNNVLGLIAHAASAADAMITCASAVSACALAALLVPAIRRVSALPATGSADRWIGSTVRSGGQFRRRPG